MSKFFEKRVEKVAKKALAFFIFTFSLLTCIIIFQIVFLGILDGNHQYTWALIPVDPSNIVLWILSGIILAIDLFSTVYMIFWLIKKYKNPFIYKTNLYIIIWIVLVFILNILIPNIIPINYVYPIIAIILGSVATVLV